MKPWRAISAARPSNADLVGISSASNGVRAAAIDVTGATGAGGTTGGTAGAATDSTTCGAGAGAAPGADGTGVAAVGGAVGGTADGAGFGSAGGGVRMRSNRFCSALIGLSALAALSAPPASVVRSTFGVVAGWLCENAGRLVPRQLIATTTKLPHKAYRVEHCSRWSEKAKDTKSLERRIDPQCIICSRHPAG